MRSQADIDAGAADEVARFVTALRCEDVPDRDHVLLYGHAELQRMFPVCPWPAHEMSKYIAGEVTA